MSKESDKMADQRDGYVTVSLRDLVAALRGAAGNTDTDPRWLAANELRDAVDWDWNTTLIVRATREEPKRGGFIDGRALASALKKISPEAVTLILEKSRELANIDLLPIAVLLEKE